MIKTARAMPAESIFRDDVRVRISEVTSGNDPAQFESRYNQFRRNSAFQGRQMTYSLEEITRLVQKCAVSSGDKFRGIQTYLVRLDTKLCYDLLLQNVSNTRLSRRVVVYLQDIATDEWRFTGAPLIIGDNGSLLNGQQRLISFYMGRELLKQSPLVLIVLGVENKSANFIDIGRNRSFASFIRRDGFNTVDTRFISSVTRLLHTVDGGFPYHRRNETSVNSLYTFFRQHQAFILEHMSAYSRHPLTGRMSTLLFFLTRDYPSMEKHTLSFMSALADPPVNNEENKKHVCKIIKRRLEDGDTGHKFKSGQEGLYLLLVAFRYYLEGTPYRSLGVASKVVSIRAAVEKLLERIKIESLPTSTLG